MKVPFKISCYSALVACVVLAACAPSATQKPDSKAGAGSAQRTGS